MDQFPTIYLMKGATTVVQVDLTDFDMQGGYAVLAVSEARSGKVLRAWKMEERRVHEVVFPDEFTAELSVSDSKYVYDIMWHLNDERFAQCAPSPIDVASTAGGYPYVPGD